MSEKEFIDGLSAKAPHEKAPEFIKAKGSINLKAFSQYLRDLKQKEPDAEWLNYDIKVSQGGKWYVERDTWKPEKQPDSKPEGAPVAYEPDSDDIPF